MLSTCYHCHAKLGANEALEALPIGRRIAYDGERGRVWVICGKCARWNLTPFEERWEAVEQAERLYRGTRSRVSTDNIALAKTKEGTELVRIGRPLRPEFAAWRFGSELRRRADGAWKSPANVASMVYLGAATVYLGYNFAGHAGLVQTSFGAFLGTVGLMLSTQTASIATSRRTLQRARTGVHTVLPSGSGQPLALTRSALGAVRVEFDQDDGALVHLDVRPARASGPLRQRWIGALHVNLSEKPTRMSYAGEDAKAMLRSSLAALHVFGASRAEVRDMLDLTERLRPEGAFDLLRPVAATYKGREGASFPLSLVGTARRLGVEMLLAEDDERRLLNGELAELYERWQEAERVAGIADRLLAELE